MQPEDFMRLALEEATRVPPLNANTVTTAK